MREPGAGGAGLLPEISLAGLAEILLRRRWSFVLIVLASLVATCVHVFLLRGDVFVAEAKLLVRLGQEQAPLPTMISDRGVVTGAQPSHVNTEIDMIRSRDTVARLIDSLDLTPQPRPPATSLFGQVKDAAREAWHAVRDLLDGLLAMAGLRTPIPPREAAIEMVTRSLLLESAPNTNVITVRVLWPERGAPGKILEELLDLYLEHRPGIFQGSTAAGFFRERRQEASQRLSAAEAALAGFERQHAISAPEEQRSALLRTLAEAEAAVASARLELELSEASVRQLDAALASGEDGASARIATLAQPGNGVQQALATELATLAARSAGSQTTLSAADATVRRQRAEIEAISRMLAQQLRATRAQRREELSLREARRDELRNELAALHAAQIRWHELRRDVASAQRAFDFADTRLNEASGIAALEAARIGSVAVVQRPAELPAPVGVRKSSLLVLGAVAGLLLGLIWVTVREFFDHRLHAAADVERRLGLRVLAAVPLARGGLPVR